jgi:hypothetical protein
MTNMIAKTIQCVGVNNSPINPPTHSLALLCPATIVRA